MRTRLIVVTALGVFLSLTIQAATTVAHKGIVPIVGSTTPTRDSVGFETSIVIVGKAGLHGRLVFHPAGQVADDDTDPVLPYNCPGLMCARINTNSFGQVPLIGSLDIIPDPDSDQTIPSVLTRIIYFSDSYPAVIRPLGTAVPRIISDEWFHQQAEGAKQSSVFMPNLGLSVRAKLGFRTLTPITYALTLIRNGTPDDAPIMSGLTLPADYTMLLPIEQLIGRSLERSEDVRVDLESGSAIVFYSYTHNFTNEPDVVVPPAFGDPLAQAPNR